MNRREYNRLCQREYPKRHPQPRRKYQPIVWAPVYRELARKAWR